MSATDARVRYEIYEVDRTRFIVETTVGLRSVYTRQMRRPGNPDSIDDQDVDEDLATVASSTFFMRGLLLRRRLPRPGEMRPHVAGIGEI